jgi:hypothetical protein
MRAEKGMGSKFGEAKEPACGSNLKLSATEKLK